MVFGFVMMQRLQSWCGRSKPAAAAEVPPKPLKDEYKSVSKDEYALGVPSEPDSRCCRLRLCCSRWCPSRHVWFWLFFFVVYVSAYVLWFNCDSVVWTGARWSDLNVWQFVLQNVITFRCIKKNTNEIATDLPRVTAPPDLTFEDSTTVVLMGYHTERITNYAMLFSEYTQMPTVDKVVLVWNNVAEPPPAVPTGVVVIAANENDLYNRYVLGNSEINSPLILTVDDDVVLTEDLIMGMVTAAYSYDDHLIGTDLRRINNETRSYDPGSYGLGIVIGKTIMMSLSVREALGELPRDVRNNITSPDSPCFTMDDIVLNAFHASLFNKGPVIVTRDEYPNLRFELPSTGGNSDGSLWHGRRSACVDYILNHYAFQPVAAKVRCPCGRGFYGDDFCTACDEGLYSRDYGSRNSTCSQCPVAFAESGIFPENLPVPCRQIGFTRTVLLFSLLIYPVAYLVMSIARCIQTRARKLNPKYNYDANMSADEFDRELDTMLNKDRLDDIDMP